MRSAHDFLIMCSSSFVQQHVSQGNGHYFPLKNQTSESHNPLLANEDMWEESGEGSDEESLGESPEFGYIASFQLLHTLCGFIHDAFLQKRKFYVT